MTALNDHLDTLTKIKLLILDVDGILTDGKLHYSAQGELFKCFHVHDGLGIKLVQQIGIPVAIITARENIILTNRFNELGIKTVMQGQHNKLEALQKVCDRHSVNPQHAAYMGDDIQDLCIHSRVGLSITVPNATNALLQRCNAITQREGGQGAVREVCEAILSANNKWEAILTKATENGATA